MGKTVDVRNIINPHKNCGIEAQLAAIKLDSERMGWPEGTTYTATKKNGIVAAAIHSVRQERKSIVRCMWAFNLAPILGTGPKKRKEISAHITTIHKRGGIFREAATGRQSNRPGELAEMMMQASKMITDYAKGAAGQSRTGRPKKARSKAELEIMKTIWESRRYKTVAQAIVALEGAGLKRVNKNELYRLFGPRG